MDITEGLKLYGWSFWKMCATCSSTRKEKWRSDQFPEMILVLVPSKKNWSLKTKRGLTIARNHYSRFAEEMKIQYERVSKVKD